MPKQFRPIGQKRRPGEIKTNLHQLKGQDPKKIVDEIIDVISKERLKKLKGDKPTTKNGQKPRLNERTRINSRRRRLDTS